jgi:hypothetical protein
MITRSHDPMSLYTLAYTRVTRKHYPYYYVICTLIVSVLFLFNRNQSCYHLRRGVPLYKSLHRVKHFLLDREAAVERAVAASRSSSKLCILNLCEGGNEAKPTSEFYRHA